MPLFQDDILKEFGQGITDIESRRAHKKPESLVAPDIVSERKSSDWLGESFASGVEEIERSRTKETPLLPALGRAAATIPPHIARAGAGLIQRTAEYQKGERGEVRGALQTVRGVEPPRVKKETKPLTYDEGFGTFVLDLLGKGVEKVGEGIEAISETAPVKAYEKFRAKSRIAEAMVGGELKPEVMKLVRAGDKESLAQAAELLKKDKSFYQSWLSKRAEEDIAKPIARAAAVSGEALGRAIEKVRPTTRRGSYKYFVTAAIEGVGSTMGPALAVSVATKNPGLGMAVMFPQVFGEVYSETRAGGEGVLESSQKAMVYAATEVLSEGIPLGILTKPGGKLTTKIFKGATAEGVQEAVNEATQIAYDEGIIDEHTPHHEIGKRLIEAGIIGAIGGGGMAVGAHAFTGKEEDATAKLKRDVLDGITETYDKGELDVSRAIDSVMEGYRSGLIDDSDLDGLSKKYPEFRGGIEAGKKTAKIESINKQLSSAIEEGLTTGKLQDEEFTLDHAVDFIRNGMKNDIFTSEDIDGFKEKYPALKSDLNALIAGDVTAKLDMEFDEFKFEPVIKPEPIEEYAEAEIEETYLKAKERVRKEPLTLHELQERFKKRHEREATAKEQESIKRIYERAKKRAQRGKVVEEKKEPVIPKTKEEIDLEAYEPKLPPGQVEVRVKEKERTYPRGADYVAGKVAPEELEVEYKPVLKKVGKREAPWITLGGARNALESDKMKDKGVSLATHKVVKTPGGYQIVPIKAKAPALAREVKKEVKGKTLLSWVRAMGGVKDKTLPGEIRALSAKEAGVVGLTTTEAEKGLGFDEMASAAVEEGWIAKPEDFNETLRDDIFAQKEGKLRPERLADIAARTEREERRKEFDGAKEDMLDYFAKHPDEEVATDLDKWQREAITDIRSRDAERAKEIEESTLREVEAEDPDLEGLKKDEGFSEFIEGWDEAEALDEETSAELKAWRAEQKKEPVKPKPVKPEGLELKEAVSHLELTKRYVEETGKKVEKGELGKVKERYPEEWAKIEKAEIHKKELWDKLPESLRRNRGINEYTTEELGAMVAKSDKELPDKDKWRLDDTSRKILEQAERHGLKNSKEAMNLAEAIAKMEGKKLSAEHVAEATQYMAPVDRVEDEWADSGVKALKEMASKEDTDAKARARVRDILRSMGESVPTKLRAKVVKEPWETSDLAIRPNIPASYVQAKKQTDGKYKLFFTGTTSEVFEGETFVSAPEARQFFKVQQVKAQEAARKKEEVRFSVAAPMYSALTRAAESSKFPAKLPAKSVINQLKRASGVKQVEIEVSGLAEWLEGKDRVSKADVVEFLRLNEVRVEEVEKGITPEDKLTEDEIDARTEENLERDGVFPDRQDVIDELLFEDSVRISPEIVERKTKFAEHVLPGGEPGSYRELVLRVPGTVALRYEVRPYGSGFRVWDTQENIFLLGGAQNKEIAQSKATTLNAEIKRAYKSAHWDEPNVIAHIRGDVRTGPDGKRFFHVAEFQSDIYSRIVELGSERAGEIFPSAEVAAKELANLKKLFPWGENWHELVAKKALEYTVKNDLDGISWDTGRTQVDRWESALRKGVDLIEWEKGRDAPKAPQYIELTCSKNRTQVFKKRVLVQGETTIEGQRVTLNNLIGKELATKIRESSENSGSFEGKDLTIGGEFYKILYDQRIPGFLKKYGKKWGAKVGKSRSVQLQGLPDQVIDPDIAVKERDGYYVIYNVEGDRVGGIFDTKKDAEIYIGLQESVVTIHTMTITPDMREAIQTSGQTLFAKRAAPGKELTVDTARAEIVERISKKALNAMIGAKKIQFVTLDEVAEILGYVRESKDQGFYKDGIVYLIPENISEGKAWGVLMHELGVHLGYNKIFGEKLAKDVFAAFVGNKGKNTPLGRAVDKAMKRVESARVHPDFKNEEAVAYFTEEHANIDLPLHRKIIARMRLWAVKYFGVKPDIFVMDDYVALAASAMRGEVREARRAPAVEGVSEEVFYSTRGKDFIFETDCVSCDDIEALDEMIDKGKDVTYDTFVKNVGTEGLQNIFPYYDWGPGARGGLRLKDDYAVSFNKSTYQGYPCYYVVHSSIEYIYVNREAPLSKKEQKKQEERWDYEKYVDSVLAKRGVGRDVRYSVAERKDLRAWADDLIKGAKDKGHVMDKETPSPERLKETSMSILAGLNLKELNRPAKSFLQGMSPKGKGYGAFIEKWLASPEWYQHLVLKKIINHSLDKSEKFHTTFNEFNAVDDPFAEHDTVAKTLEALARKGGISKAAFILGKTSADFKKLETLLDDADVYSEKHTIEELKEKGYSEDVVQAWSIVRESYDKQLEALIKPMKDLVARIKEQAAFMGTEPVYPDFGDFIIDGKKRRLTLQEAVMEMGRYKGTYSPRIRERGAWVVTGVIEKSIAEGGTEYFRNNRKTKSFANLLRDDLKKQGYTNIKIEKESRLPEETFQAIRMAEMGTMIGHAANKGLDKYDGEMQMAFMDEIVTASADMIKSRGARATMIKRREGLAVKGYITNPLTRFVRYTGTNAAGIAKAEMAERMIKDLYGEFKDGKKVGGIDATKEGEVHSLARAYIEEQLRNTEAGDRIVGIMKGLTTLKFLGFNPRSILVNISSLTTSVPMSLHTYAMDSKGSLLRIGKMLSVGCKDYTKVMAGKRLENLDEQVFIDGFRDAGYTDAQYTRDAMGNIQGAYGTVWSKLMGGSMYAFGKSEEWVRGGTALTAFRLAKKQGLSNIKAKEKAIFATAKAHGTYGKETLPMVAWGKGVGRLGQAFYTYMKFPHNYLQMLYDAGIRKKNVKGVIFGMAAPAVLGGVAAVPMYATVMAIANALMSAIGDDRDAEKLVYDTLNEYVGKTGEEAIRGGVLGLVDVDISGSLSMGPGAIPTSLFELTGAVGGMVEDIGRGAKLITEREYGRATEKLLPKAIGNIFTAIREIKGATTGRGDRIWDEQGQPYIPEMSETAKRGLGFRSARRAILAQSTWIAKREERRFKETQSSIYKKIKFLTGRSENIKLDRDVEDRISEYNKDVLKTSNIPLITPASIERQLERMKTPTTKQKARVMASERVTRFEGSIWADALGLTDTADKIQIEVKRLSDLKMLSYSAKPPRRIEVGRDVEVVLDDDQYSRYVADTSTMVRELVDGVMNLPEWEELSDKHKAFVMRRAINKGRKRVRDRLKITIRQSRLSGK